MQNEKKRILLVDTMALFSRSYFGLLKTNMRSSQGIGTWAVYGFLKALFEQIGSYRPDFVICADEGGKGFRKTWSPEYKSGRGPSDPELINQKNFLMAGLEELGIPVIRQVGYEADDIICSITKNQLAYKSETEAWVLPASELHFRILTVDQDLLALVKPGDVELLLWKSDKSETLFTTNEDVVVNSKMGVLPHQITDYKALVGDSSDNIAGLKGFGPAAALKFFAAYDSLREAKNDGFSKLSPRHQKLILDNTSQIELSYALAKLYDIPNSALVLYNMNSDWEPNVFLNVLEFRSFLSQFQNPLWKSVTFLYGVKKNEEKLIEPVSS